MLLRMPSIAIIIPCYNEEDRLAPPDFTHFLEGQPSRTLVFVNDGSTDRTAVIIDAMAKEKPGQVLALHLKRNRGKAFAVTEGFRFCLSSRQGSTAPAEPTGSTAPAGSAGPEGPRFLPFDFIGYLDADLSTGLEEMARISAIVMDKRLDFAFGSRIKTMNTTIHRSFFRHIVGRTLATIVDSRLRIGIYDTQCGAKLFKADLARTITREPFHTRWLFDVEIFMRILRESPAARGEEIPLLTWNAGTGSKLSIWQIGKVVRDLNRLFKKYPR
jgi:dolichyl-phosphate beta-glucosyltransferase